MSDEPKKPQPAEDAPGAERPAEPAPPQGPTTVWDDPELFGDGEDELLQQLRSLDEPEPSARFGATLRGQVLRRSGRLLRAQGIGDHLHTGFHALRLVARRSRVFQALALLLLALFSVLIAREAWFWIEESRHDRQGEELVQRAGESLPLPDRLPGAQSSQQLPPPADFSEEQRQAWLRSENELDRLRQLLGERSSSNYYRRLAATAGVDTRVLRRVDYLAELVASGLEKQLDSESTEPKETLIYSSAPELDLEYESIESLSLSLRALLAAGALVPENPHGAVAREGLASLQELLPRLEAPEHLNAFACALVAYLEWVLQTGDNQELQRLGGYLGRMCEMELALVHGESAKEPGPHGESQLLPITHWASPLGAIVDAGLLLRVAPALGVPPESCQELRSGMLRHLEARAERGPRSRAAAQAAQLFAFPDLVDRDALKRRLQGYRLYPDRLASDLRSVRYLAWSTSPKGYGFARVNQALRHFVANHEPRTQVERASLLLVQLFYLAPYLD